MHTIAVHPGEKYTVYVPKRELTPVYGALALSDKSHFNEVLPIIHRKTGVVVIVALTSGT